MENLEKLRLFFAKHLETIALLFVILGVIVFCIIYQPKKAQPILDLIGLKRIDSNTPVEIDKAIMLFSKEASKKIPKGSNVIISKSNLKILYGINKEIIHWQIMHDFIKFNDINVYTNDSIAAQCIKDKGEIYTIRASLDNPNHNGVIPIRVIDMLLGESYNDFYSYVFFISIDKNEENATNDINILARNYVIKHLNSSFFQDYELLHCELLNEKLTEEATNDSLMEQECITELEESLRSFYSELDGCTIGGLLYAGNCTSKEEIGKHIEMMLNEKNCKSEMNFCDENDKCKLESCIDDECPYDCEYKSKCFDYYYHNFDACGSMSMKSTSPIKGCSKGSVWKLNFCEPDGSIPYYSVPENIECKNITPKRVKDNTTPKEKSWP